MPTSDFDSAQLMKDTVGPFRLGQTVSHNIRHEARTPECFIPMQKCRTKKLSDFDFEYQHYITHKTLQNPKIPRGVSLM